MWGARPAAGGRQEPTKSTTDHMKGQSDRQGSHSLHSYFWKSVQMKNVLSVWVCPGICLLIYSQEIVTCARYDPAAHIWSTFFCSLPWFAISCSQSFLHRPAALRDSEIHARRRDWRPYTFFLYDLVIYISPTMESITLPLTTRGSNVCKKSEHQYPIEQYIFFYYISASWEYFTATDLLVHTGYTLLLTLSII